MDLELMPATDAVFLLVHNEFSGKAYVRRDFLRCALVSAQLADLVLTDRAIVRDSRIAARSHAPGGTAARAVKTDTGLGHVILHRLATNSESQTVRSLTATVGDHLHSAVADRLCRTGVLHARTSRTLFNREPRYPARTLLEALAPKAALCKMIEDTSRFTRRSAFLLCLLQEFGADGVLNDESITGRQVRQVTEEIRSQVPKPLTDLLGSTDSAIRKMVTTAR
jgi:hypothetical protein